MADKLTPEELGAIRGRHERMLRDHGGRFHPISALAVYRDRAALLRHVEAQEQEVERLRACVIACGEVVLVEGNWRDLTPMVLNSIVKYVRENAAAERKLARLVDWLETLDGHPLPNHIETILKEARNG